MLQWLRDWWEKVQTKPCARCGEPVLVTDYRRSGRRRRGSWWSGEEVELECPHCGATYWIRK